MVKTFLAAAIAALLQPAAQAPASAPAPAAPVDAAVTVGALADMLAENYVFPDTGNRYAAALRAHLAEGLYAGLTGQALADRLTDDLRAVSPDNHLRVLPPGADGAAPGPRPGPPPGPPPGAGGPQPGPAPVRRPPPMEQAQWIAPGIAFVRFNMFPGDADTLAAVRAFMESHVEARAIIFDIRTHRGGSPAEMNVIFPYLFARPTTLISMDTRASVARAGRSPIDDDPNMVLMPSGPDVVRRDHRVTPHPTERRLFDAQVFVLTSNFSGSAAEHFALALKRTRRATLIGEATGGANHFGGGRVLPGNFGVFMPVGRSYDPDTGRDWEGTGIAPDVAVPKEQALVEALTRLGVERAEAERLSATVAPTWPVRRPRPAAGSAPPASPPAS